MANLIIKFKKNGKKSSFFQLFINPFILSCVLISNKETKDMDTKERHIRENESKERREERLAAEKHKELDNSDLIADGLKANGKKRKNNSTIRTNKLWLWFGILILIIILFWWLCTIGMFGDLTGAFNG